VRKSHPTLTACVYELVSQLLAAEAVINPRESTTCPGWSGRFLVGANTRAASASPAKGGAAPPAPLWAGAALIGEAKGLYGKRATMRVHCEERKK
jgi:hypothetical protein